jgi:hypothetical protein
MPTSGRRLLGTVTLVLAVSAVFVVTAVPALAHYPKIEADPVCLEDGSIVVNFTAWSWLQDPNDDARSGNPNIGIYVDGSKVDQGAFVTPDYGFSGSFPWPGGQSIVVMARADAPFNNGLFQGSFRETTVIRPPCESTTNPTPPSLPPPPPAGEIGDLVWHDINGDGYQGDFEPGVEGVTVNLLDGTGTVMSSAATGASGEYRFSGLAAGTYEIQFVLPEGYDFTLANAAGDALDSDADLVGLTGAISLATGEIDLTWDAGVYETPLVLPQVITASTTTPPETLPFTGAIPQGLGGFGAGLVVLGGLVMLVVRRREEETAPAGTDGSILFSVYRGKHRHRQSD